MLNYARLCYNYANYALCSDCVIMPKSNAGIIGLPQGSGLSKTRVPTGMDTVLYDSTAKSVNDQNVIDAIVNKHTVQLTPYYIYYKAYSIIRIKCRTQ